MKLPESIQIFRKNRCSNCTCDVDFSDPCASCPNNKWKKTLCIERFKLVDIPISSTESSPIKTPTISSMVKTATKSTVVWASNGFKIADEKVFEDRLSHCKSCEFWDSEALNGTGRCRKCGCSTWAKLRMATEKCPIGKW